MKGRDFLESFKKPIETCSHCGMCQHVCPPFIPGNREGYGPRGKMALLKAFMEGKLKAADISEDIFMCAACGLCDDACPSGLPLKDIFQAARFALGPAGGKNVMRRKFLQFLALRPSLLDCLQPPLVFGQKLRKSNSLKSIPLASRPYHFKKFPEEDKSLVQARGKILLFSGCIARRVYPGIIDACKKALAFHGHETIAPDCGVCCGRPFFMQGAYAGALALVRANLAKIELFEVKMLLTPCPACLDAIKRIWPNLEGLKEEERKKCRKLAKTSFDINTFLARQKSVGLSSAQGQKGLRFIWHKPCLQDGEAANCAKKLLGQGLPDDFLALPEDQCCGGGMNVFSLPVFARNNSFSAQPVGQMGEKCASSLRDAVMAAGKRVVTACPGCMLALDRAMRLAGDNTGPAHSVEIYAANIS